MPNPVEGPVMKSIELAVSGRTVRAGWFAGASRDAVIEAVRGATGLADSAVFHLETADGIVVALDDSVPSGVALRVIVEGAQTIVTSAPIPVPGPKGYPIVGNLPELRRADGAMASIASLHAEFGDFFAFHARHQLIYFCADADIISEIQAAPEIFAKMVDGKTGQADLAKKSIGNALFTSSDNDPMWHQAHRILMPAFGLGALKNYYGRMVAVADDLLDHLDGLAPGQSFLATDLMTRMTFEAIAYAAFNKRYNGIGSVDLPPFVAAMNVVLADAQAESRRLLPEIFYREVRRERAAADQLMMDEVDAIIAERRAMMEKGEPVPTDLLQIMLTTPDKVTGLRLPDDNIRGQLATFLIAGHETTSGLLSYALYYLWKNPDAQEKLIAEADAVLGRDYSYQPTYEDCARLEYTQRILKETLRLSPTAPMFTRTVMRDTTVGQGRYQVRAGEVIFLSLGTLQRSPRYWGDDAALFRPDRFLPEVEQARHPDAYHPFGMGMRACIGFQFALLEAKMVLARFAQRYVARPVDSNYVLRDKQTLTIKPDHLEMLLEKRPEIKDRFPQRPEQSQPQQPVAVAVGSRPMTVLYGSNMGGSREIAADITLQAGKRGFAAIMQELDDQVGKPWLTNGPVVIVTSTYNGTPPDDAARFAAYLGKAPAGTCRDVRYAVLGCGNKQWRQTFQKFPQTVDARLKELGGDPFLSLGQADADGDFEAAVETWTAALWAAVEATFTGGETPAATDDGAPTVRVEIVNFAGASPATWPLERVKLDRESWLAQVQVNRELQTSGSPASTRHIEIPLPAGVTYAAGDHLGVFPRNPTPLVEAVAKRCGMTPSTTVLLSSLQSDANPAGGLPFGVPVSVGEILADHVDLTGPVTRRELRAWAKTADCPPDRQRLAQWLEDFPKLMAESKPDMMELLDQVPSVRIDLAAILTLRPPLKPRYYSISSSPRLSPNSCSVTVGLHRFKCAEGAERDGLCSSYLAGSAETMPLRVVVKDTGSSFRLPADVAAPVILVGPGTGLAPLRGFIQERHALRAQGVPVGPMVLFFGCRNEEDFIYREELETYLKEGTLSLLAVAFSRLPDRPKTYVQDLIKQNAASLAEMVAAGGSILVCGNARGMAPDVRQAFAEIVGGAAEVESLERQGRYLQDVWASG